MTENTKQPNILFIMLDQLRYDYLSCAGAEFVRTPSIDKIAKMGMRFTNCFTNAPLCAPARIGLSTGLMPSRLGSVDNNSYLPLSTPTMYQRFRDYGYRVGCVGKLDLAKPSPYNGRFGDRSCVFGWGFTHPEECEGKMHAGLSPLPRGPYGYYLEEKGLYKDFHNDYINRRDNGWNVDACHDSVLAAEDFEDSYIGRRAAKWINTIPDDFPWHLLVSFVGPHDPYDPPTEYADKYRKEQFPDPIIDDMQGKPNWVRDLQQKDTMEEVQITRRQYCAAIELIDEQIGLILESLESRGMMDNTYIVFTSDHGDMMGDHGLYQKTVPYEPSIHVPLIVAGPGIESNLIKDSLIELIDLNPTVCELAGIPKLDNIDALSFVNVLNGESERHRENIVIKFKNYKCIRDKKYKYIDNFNDIGELYDLENDTSELNNILESNKDIAVFYKKVLKERFLEGKWLR